jgi:hypothetical protein
MKIYESISFDMTAPLPGGKFEIVSSTVRDYNGPLALCGGGDSTVKGTEQSQQQFTTTLQNAFKQQFGANTGILNFLTGKLTAAVNNPQGFDAKTLASLNTNAVQQTATDYANASKATGAQIAARGGSTLPSGVNAQIQGQLAQAGANEETGQLGQIQLANEQQKQSNYWKAVDQLGGVANQESPAQYGSLANGGAGAVAGLSQAYSASEQASPWNQAINSFTSGLGKGLSSFATGGLSNATGWGKPPSQT